MLFSNAIAVLSSEVSKTGDDNETKEKIKQSLNFAKTEVGKSSFWKQLYVPNNELILIPKYETGYASVTQDSRTVTLSGGASVSAGFIGRFFKAQNSGGEYEIINVDTDNNQLILKSPIVEESAIAQSYYIRKNFYRVNSDILTVLPNMDIDNHPSPFEIEGYNEYASPYSTGTISVTENSNVLTGTGTAFFDNVFPGDLIEVESEVYRVKYVKSDTSIVMTNFAVTSFTGTYRIRSDTPYKAKITDMRPWVDGTKKTILKYGYIRSLYPMVNDSDDTELPNSFDRCILDFAKAEFGRLSKDSEYKNDFLIAQARLEKLKLDRELVYHATNVFRPSIPRTMGRGYQ